MFCECFAITGIPKNKAGIIKEDVKKIQDLGCPGFTADLFEEESSYTLQYRAKDFFGKMILNGVKKASKREKRCAASYLLQDLQILRFRKPLLRKRLCRMPWSARFRKENLTKENYDELTLD